MRLGSYGVKPGEDLLKSPPEAKTGEPGMAPPTLQIKVSESMGICPAFLFSRCVAEVFTFPGEGSCTADWPSTQCSRE